MLEQYTLNPKLQAQDVVRKTSFGDRVETTCCHGMSWTLNPHPTVLPLKVWDHSVPGNLLKIPDVLAEILGRQAPHERVSVGMYGVVQRVFLGCRNRKHETPVCRRFVGICLYIYIYTHTRHAEPRPETATNPISQMSP